MLRIKLTALLLLVSLIALTGCQLNKTATVKKESSKQIAGSDKVVQSSGDFPHTGRGRDLSEIGTVVPDTATAERYVGAKVRLPKIPGLKPEIRVSGTETDAVAFIVFKNGVNLGQSRRNLRRDMLQMRQVDTETASRTDEETSKAIWAQYYRGQAQSTQRALAMANGPTASQAFYYREIKGHPAMVVEKGYNADEGYKEYFGPNIDWYQDGFELSISGPTDMTLDELIEIAKSAM